MASIPENFWNFKSKTNLQPHISLTIPELADMLQAAIVFQLFHLRKSYSQGEKILNHTTRAQARGHFSIVSFVVAITFSLMSIFVGSSAVWAASSPAKSLAYGSNHAQLILPALTTPPQLVKPGANPPPTDAECRQQFHRPCYSPQEMRTAYDLNPILN